MDSPPYVTDVSKRERNCHPESQMWLVLNGYSVRIYHAALFKILHIFPQSNCLEGIVIEDT